ncbi:MAG TPA: LysM peptidoglycan-binding domain-containing protein [Nocardioidaceae bacterium]|nr:LysM peptidoglycan-binding domain-containing protein [Nocardioidaceae bacterium]
MTSPATWLHRRRPRSIRLTRRIRLTRPASLTRATALKRLTASTTAGGMMLVGTPLLMEYVVRPGDTLSEIAERHHTSVSRLVQNNDLHPSGNRVVAGQTLEIPAAHGRDAAPPAPASKTISPDARRMVRYTVKAGDTPSGLAVRFHAWTAELIAMNGSTLRVGEHIRIPVVLAAVARERKTHSTPSPAPAPSTPQRSRRGDNLADQLRNRPDPSRATVRRIIERTAVRYGVDPQLALAISWQEAGWQQHHVSHADAVGAMQVIPATGEWMSGVVGRDLDLLDVHDNVTAGVALLKVLTDAAPGRQAIAGYYQGLAGVRKNGMYDDTKHYVANVLYLKKRFEQGRYPA